MRNAPGAVLWPWAFACALAGVPPVSAFVATFAPVAAACGGAAAATLLLALAAWLHARGRRASWRGRVAPAGAAGDAQSELQLERVHSVFQSLIEGVVVIDTDGATLLANPAARQLLGLAEAAIVGRPFLPALTGSLHERLGATLRQVSGHGRGRAEVLGIHVGARVFDVSVARVESERPGSDVACVIVFMDVTRKHEIARLKDEFLSNVSHELRTPLTNICAFSEILGQVTPADSDQWQEFLTILGCETRRLKRLVDDVLDFSRLEAGHTEFDRELLDLRLAARVAREQLAARLHDKRIAVELCLPDESVPAWLDKGRLEQILVRLLDNAIRFTPEDGKIRVAVEAHGEQSEISVDDSGKGIPAEERETVFERFSQLGEQLTDKPAGQGLSLAICRRLLGAQGGMIWCEGSELGGARFRMLVPAHAQRPIAEEVALEVGAR